LIELSGGTYEHMALLDEEGSATATGEKVMSAASARREAYFLDMAQKIRAVSDIPLMVSGGFRTLQGMEEAIESGVTNLIGLGRPLSAEPELPNGLLDGTIEHARISDLDLTLGDNWFSPKSENKRIRHLNSFAEVGWHCVQIDRMGRDLDINWNMSPLTGMLKFFGGGMLKQVLRKHK